MHVHKDRGEPCEGDYALYSCKARHQFRSTCAVNAARAGRFKATQRVPHCRLCESLKQPIKANVRCQIKVACIYRAVFVIRRRKKKELVK
jgi:hypothetical protein